MPVFWSSARVRTRDERRELRARERGWYAHYRRLGLGHRRADMHARRKALAGRTPPASR